MTINDKNDWWYEKNGEKKGPFTFTTIGSFIDQGEIDPETLIWRTGMQDWVAARTMSQLTDVFAGTPPPLPPSDIGSEPVNVEDESIAESTASSLPSEQLATPWPRFFARVFDIWLESLPVGFLLGVTLYAIDAEFAEEVFSNIVLAGMISLPIVLVLDGILVGLFGNSVGKAILGIKVMPNDRGTMSVGDAISRNMGVWTSGLAIGFPIVNLFFMASAYRTLKSGQELRWDKSAGVRVVRIYAEPWRYFVFVVLFGILLFINAAFYAAG